MRTGLFKILNKEIALVVAFAASFPFWINAQKPIRTNFRTDISIPVISSNYALRKSFSEIIDINMSYHLSLGNRFTLGPAMGFTHFTVDSLTYEKNRTRMFIYTPAVELGYQTYMGQNSLFSGTIQVGYALSRFTNVFSDSLRTPTGYNFNALSLEPTLRFLFFTSDRVALGLKLSYKIIFHSFDYRSVYFDRYQTYTDQQNSGAIQYFNAGLNVLVGTSRKKVK